MDCNNIEEIKNAISESINYRLSDPDYKPYHCKFLFTVPRYVDGILELEATEEIKTVIDILNKNGVDHSFCDSVPGCYNLNRDWISTEQIVDAVVEYGGVYPIHWDIDSIAVLDKMEYDGKLIINVAWYDEDGNYICDNQ